MSAAMFWAALPTSAAVFSAEFWSYWTVTALPSLLTLQAPSSNNGMAKAIRMEFLPGFGRLNAASAVSLPIRFRRSKQAHLLTFGRPEQVGAEREFRLPEAVA